jgi:hypothetical protein
MGHSMSDERKMQVSIQPHRISMKFGHLTDTIDVGKITC